MVARQSFLADSKNFRRYEYHMDAGHNTLEYFSSRYTTHTERRLDVPYELSQSRVVDSYNRLSDDNPSAAGGIRNAGSFENHTAGAFSASLSYYRNRFYDAETARWTQEDPIGIAAGINLFLYGNNNPAVFADRFGTCPDKGPCPIELAPVFAIATRQDSRPHFGSLIDMTQTGFESARSAFQSMVAWQQQKEQQQSFTGCMSDAGTMVVAAGGIAVGAVVAGAGQIMNSQGTKAVAHGTLLLNRFFSRRLPSSALIEDGIAMMSNGRAAIAIGRTALTIGIGGAGLAIGYTAGAAGACTLDRNYYR